MNELIEILSDLNYVAETYSSALMHNRVTKSHAKRMLISELCSAINSFVMLGIDIYLYTFPCTQAIRRLNLATNDQQIVEACLILLKWTTDEIYGTEGDYNV